MQRWDDLTPEEQQRYLTAEELRTQLAERSLVAEQLSMALHVKHTQLAAVTADRDVLALELFHLRSEWQAVTAERDQLRSQLERYGADQWRRGNAGKDPQEFEEWRREQ
jgi:seryl-tRNA synthetase